MARHAGVHHRVNIGFGAFYSGLLHPSSRFGLTAAESSNILKTIADKEQQWKY
jgi:hypothetical protein